MDKVLDSFTVKGRESLVVAMRDIKGGRALIIGRQRGGNIGRPGPLNPDEVTALEKMLRKLRKVGIEWWKTDTVDPYDPQDDADPDQEGDDAGDDSELPAEPQGDDPAEPSNMHPSINVAARGKRPIMYWTDEFTPQHFADRAGTTLKLAGRKALVAILREGKAVNHYKGSAACRICGRKLGQTDMVGHGFIWPAKAEHYLIKHGVLTPGMIALLKAADIKPPITTAGWER